MESNKKIKAIWLAEEFVFDGKGNCINGLELIGKPLDLTITAEEPVIEFTFPKRPIVIMDTKYWDEMVNKNDS